MLVHVISNYKEKYPDLKGRALTNRLVLDLLDEDAEILRDLFGKPYVKWDKEIDPPFLSISHSGDVFACVFDEACVGLDIQAERSIDPEKITRRFFSQEERDYIESDLARFFQVWTRKEAFAKYNGRGLSQIMSGNSILNRKDVIFRDFKIKDDMYMSICRPVAMKDEENYEIQFFD